MWYCKPYDRYSEDTPPCQDCKVEDCSPIKVKRGGSNMGGSACAGCYWLISREHEETYQYGFGGRYTCTHPGLNDFRTDLLVTQPRHETIIDRLRVRWDNGTGRRQVQFPEHLNAGTVQICNGYENIEDG